MQGSNKPRLAKPPVIAYNSGDVWIREKMTANGNTSSKLIDAIHAARLSSVIVALDDGADIEAPDMHGFKGLPLRTACFEGNLAIVRELLTRGADINAAASDGPSAPLRLALRKGHQDIIALLLQQGAQIPQGLSLNADHYNGIANPLLEDAEVPTLPESQPDSNIIEFTHHDITDITHPNTFIGKDDGDTPSQFGTETNVLSMDLLFMDDSDGHHTAYPKGKR